MTARPKSRGARSGQIVSLDVDAGAVVALVQGTRPQPYRVRIGLRVWDKTEWRRVERASGDEVINLVATRGAAEW